jgi:hypothetical protein
MIPSGGHFNLKREKRAMNLPDTISHQRREQATDTRGVPASYARAMKALDGVCAHCSHRAVVVDGHGVGLCAIHRHARATAVQTRERWRRAIDMAQRDL